MDVFAPERDEVFSDGVAYEVTRILAGQRDRRHRHRRPDRRAGGRQDRHHRRLRRRLVRRLHAASTRPRSGWATRTATGARRSMTASTGSPWPAAPSRPRSGRDYMRMVVDRDGGSRLFPLPNDPVTWSPFTSDFTRSAGDAQRRRARPRRRRRRPRPGKADPERHHHQAQRPPPSAPSPPRARRRRPPRRARSRHRRRRRRARRRRPAGARDAAGTRPATDAPRRRRRRRRLRGRREGGYPGRMMGQVGRRARARAGADAPRGRRRPAPRARRWSRRRWPWPLILLSARPAATRRRTST